MNNGTKIVMGLATISAIAAGAGMMMKEDKKMARKINKVVNHAVDNAVDTIKDAADKLSGSLK